jgi:hypothetical protein
LADCVYGTSRIAVAVVATAAAATVATVAAARLACLLVF